jgi:hypothetical protein
VPSVLPLSTTISSQEGESDSELTTLKNLASDSRLFRVATRILTSGIVGDDRNTLCTLNVM